MMLAVKHSIPRHALNILMELQTLCVHIGNENSITLCLVYIPPNSPELHIQSLCDFISTTVSHSNNKYLLLGDFNLPTINWDILQGETPISNFFCDLVFNLNLVQMINEPTHIYGNILDLVLTTNDDNISSLSVYPYASLPIISDHFAITFSLNTSLLSSPKFLPFYVLREIMKA